MHAVQGHTEWERLFGRLGTPKSWRMYAIVSRQVQGMMHSCGMKLEHWDLRGGFH